jgi:hypothetical protein
MAPFKVSEILCGDECKDEETKRNVERNTAEVKTWWNKEVWRKKRKQQSGNHKRGRMANVDKRNEI